MKVKRTIIFEHDEPMISEIEIGWLEYGDQVRNGFEKGTLKSVTFELHTGTKIIYEEVE